MRKPKAWIGLLMCSSDPKTRERGRKIKAKQDSEEAFDLRNLARSPGGSYNYWKKS